MSFSSQPRVDYNGPPSPRRHAHARGSSQQHVPSNPSRLRESITRSPEQNIAQSPSQDQEAGEESSPLSSSASQPDNEEEDAAPVQDGLVESNQKDASPRTRLLEDYHRGAACGSRNCNHGTFSPRVRSSQNSISSDHDFGGRFGASIGENGGDSDSTRGLLGDTFVGGLFGGSRKDKQMSTTQWLASKHGFTNQRLLLVLYTTG